MIIIGISVLFGKVLPSGEYRRSLLFLSKDLVLELGLSIKGIANFIMHCGD
jgi:hypothetical protein